MAEAVTSHSCIDIIKRIITHRPPPVVVENFQSPFTWTVSTHEPDFCPICWKHITTKLTGSKL